MLARNTHFVVTSIYKIIDANGSSESFVRIQRPAKDKAGGTSIEGIHVRAWFVYTGLSARLTFQVLNISPFSVPVFTTYGRHLRPRQSWQTAL